MSWKIYSYPNNPRVWKILIAAQYAGIEIETPAFKIGADNKTPEFLGKNPVGKVPVLECPDGYIWESNAIARYVSRQGKSKLYGNSLHEDALIDQWMDYAVNEIELPSAAWLFPILNIVPYHKEATNKAKGDIHKAMTVLNTHLLTRTYLVGNRISLADVVVCLVLYRLYKMVFDPTFRKPFPNVNRWYETLVNQKEFHAVMGDVELSQKMMVATAPAEEEKKKKRKRKKKKLHNKRNNNNNNLLFRRRKEIHWIYCRNQNWIWKNGKECIRMHRIRKKMRCRGFGPILIMKDIQFGFVIINVIPILICYLKYVILWVELNRGLIRLESMYLALCLFLEMKPKRNLMSRVSSCLEVMRSRRSLRMTLLLKRSLLEK